MRGERREARGKISERARGVSVVVVVAAAIVVGLRARLSRVHARYITSLGDSIRNVVYVPSVGVQRSTFNIQHSVFNIRCSVAWRLLCVFIFLPIFFSFLSFPCFIFFTRIIYPYSYQGSMRGWRLAVSDWGWLPPPPRSAQSYHLISWSFF